MLLLRSSTVLPEMETTRAQVDLLRTVESSICRQQTQCLAEQVARLHLHMGSYGAWDGLGVYSNREHPPVKPQGLQNDTSPWVCLGLEGLPIQIHTLFECEEGSPPLHPPPLPKRIHGASTGSRTDSCPTRIRSRYDSATAWDDRTGIHPMDDVDVGGMQDEAPWTLASLHWRHLGDLYFMGHLQYSASQNTDWCLVGNERMTPHYRYHRIHSLILY